MQNYRTTNSREEILNIIEKSSTDSKSIIWQSYSDHRNIFEIDVIELDQLRGLVRLNIDQNKNLINDKLLVYLKLSYRDTIFKGYVKDITSTEVSIEIPQEIKTTELREYPRLKFNINEERFVGIGIHSNLVKGASQQLKTRLIDISIFGMGLFVSEENINFFQVGNEVFLESLGDIDLIKRHPAQVKYTQKQKIKVDGKIIKGHKVGVKFSLAISQEKLDNYLENISGESSPVANELLVDDKLKRKINDARDKMLAQIKENPNKRRVFKKLQVARDKEKYMQVHINLLCTVSCRIARSLNWITDATLEKFIYMAYFHDVAFFDDHKLARIKDFEHFNKVKDKLTKQERELYLKSPYISSDFAKNDPDAPEGIELMLLQQFEKPDGSGFPNGSDHKRITPLAALFIVSHDFVDYVISNKKWSLYEYNKIIRKKYRGGFFEKIIETLENIRHL